MGESEVFFLYTLVMQCGDIGSDSLGENTYQIENTGTA